MKLSWDQICTNALTFSDRWKDVHSEVAHGQSFMEDFLRVFGIKYPENGKFEYEVVDVSGKKGYIDYFWAKKIAIEMKSKGENLKKAREQLQDYLKNVPPDDIPDLWLVCDFENMQVIRPSLDFKVITFKTKKLYEKTRLFGSLAGYSHDRNHEDLVEVNIKAAEKMATLHDSLKKYGYDGHNLEVYLVRLLFCLFANSTRIFPDNYFFNYLETSKADGSDLASKLSSLFEVLNMSDDDRSKRTLMNEELKKFQYINGSLFSEVLLTADFDAKMRKTLLDCANFDWSSISPAIFGSIFQGIMDKNSRRQIGAHYTSEENILKLINPLFLNGLWIEFENSKTDPKKLDEFHKKLSKLKFLDPACGCGNFLIVTYREIRKLELEVVKLKQSVDNKIKMEFDIQAWLRVNVNQFFGIEYLDFPCQIAQVGMWLCDHQMNLKASEVIGTYYKRLPLKEQAKIINANALRLDWEKIVPRNELSYILGNPPFNGARTMSQEQKSDMRLVFSNQKNTGNLDYVTAWYKKASEYMKETQVKCAFVSTNSISQGEQPAILWKPLMSEGIHINFGQPTFKWANEAKGQAAVHCIIIGFSNQQTKHDLNQYLLDAPVVFIENRQHPLCDVPEMWIGNKPIDGGNYLFSLEEKNEFIKKEPRSERWFYKWIGSDELINKYFRYCLLLKDCPLEELRTMHECMKRVKAVQNYRQASKSVPTKKLANTPLSFHVEKFPSSEYIAIPEISSEKRNYIPIDFIKPEILASNRLKIIPDATFYHFGVLTSSIHMAWVKTVCGRFELRYCYSKDIVYNNFPWPKHSEKYVATIEQTAKAILRVRKQFPKASLADLYDPLTMPKELLQAHLNNDKAVSQAYGFKFKNQTDDTYVKALFRLYQQLTNY